MNKLYIQINNILYPVIEILDKLNDPDWDYRHTKTLRLENITYEQITELFSNNPQWDIISEWIEYPDNENEEPIIHRDICNNEGFIIPGPITDWKDGTISIVIGKLTDLEEAYKLLYGIKEEE